MGSRGIKQRGFAAGMKTFEFVGESPDPSSSFEPSCLVLPDPSAGAAAPGWALLASITQLFNLTRRKPGFEPDIEPRYFTTMAIGIFALADCETIV